MVGWLPGRLLGSPNHGTTHPSRRDHRHPLHLSLRSWGNPPQPLTSARPCLHFFTQLRARDPTVEMSNIPDEEPDEPVETKPFKFVTGAFLLPWTRPSHLVRFRDIVVANTHAAGT